MDPRAWTRVQHRSSSGENRCSRAPEPEHCDSWHIICPFPLSDALIFASLVTSCYGLKASSQKTHQSPNSQYLRKQPYLEIGSWQMYLVKMRSHWNRRGPSSHMTCVLMRREGHTQGGGLLVMKEAEIGGMWLQAKECQALLATTRLGRSKEEGFPESQRER